MAENTFNVPSRPETAAPRPAADGVAHARGLPSVVEFLTFGILGRRTAEADKAMKAGPAQRVDSTREVVETIVFVVVLVLLLKSFVAEAFVIPTGSMAETLYGYQKLVDCPQCGYEFPVNCSSEVEDHKPPLSHCVCPNCFYTVGLDPERGPGCNSGDRVLVGKFLYDLGLADVQVFDVVVFKFPEEPQYQYVPVNYIKRLIGKPRQTIGIYHGDLYVAEGLDYAPEEEDPNLPPRRQMYKDKRNALLEEWDPNKDPQLWKLLRKPPDKMGAMCRIVYDNDHRARDLEKMQFPPRWAPERDGSGIEPADYRAKRKRAEDDPSWTPDTDNSFRHAARSDGGVEWLRYRHLQEREARDPDAVRPALIKDFLGYNSETSAVNWVGDLLLECKVTVEQAEGSFVLELSKGRDRFRAVWQLPAGTCTLLRLQDGKEPEKLAEAPTPLKKPGSYRVRFANIDCRLTVWVDRHLQFGAGVAYDPPTVSHNGGHRIAYDPLERNDLEPASIGVEKAGVRVHQLKLWRDTFYTTNELGGPSTAAMTLYVQPGHYLCLGDNSPRSSDSRTWGPKDPRRSDSKGGLVPHDLMLGRALLVYWPYWRFGPIE